MKEGKRRFVNEYANYKTRKLYAVMHENPGAARDIAVKLSEIDHAVGLLRRGFITVDEAMRLVSEA